MNQYEIDFENILIPTKFIIDGVESNGEYYSLTEFGKYITTKYKVDLGYTDDNGNECFLCFNRDWLQI